MPQTPWRVSFPVVVDPASRIEHLALIAVHIPDARGPHVLPTMCKVLGFDRKGQHRQFTISIAAYRHAELTALKKMIEVDNIEAPKGMVVDATGRVMKSEPEAAPLSSRNDTATKVE